MNSFTRRFMLALVAFLIGMLMAWVYNEYRNRRESPNETRRAIPIELLREAR